ncbi:LytTR family DNA-binding domain-containing protein [Microbacterium sp.]|uniref:LytR/AlgR family response regulator transcription factor n=1 Tax=Microbacterium sp. TaxID=51671 RepID=UPI00289B4D5D|nr:LytTR family DNA-binding domain-containing protein [Microbacterium sp.]
MIDVLIADDEAPALAELAHLLRADPRIGEIVQARSGADALRQLAERAVSVAFLDIHMPGLDGFALAAAMTGLATPPEIVFVTADDARAVDAFEVRAVDYLLKPVRAERLRRAVDRAIELAGAGAEGDDELLPVTVGQLVRFVRRRDVRWVHAQGDYSRLHTDDGAHLIRTPISELEERWAPHGFVRVHRSYLVAVGAIAEARLSGADPAIVLVGTVPATIPVSRRMLPAVREALVRAREAGR